MTRREQVLHWVNRQRLDRDLYPLGALRKGVPEDAHYCVLATSLDAGYVDPGIPPDGSGVWSVDVWQFDERPLPRYASEFARAFDAGRYPDLIERKRNA